VFEPLETDVLDETGMPEDAEKNAQLERSLGDALAHLTEVERVCFVLKHLEQWRLNEIAEELGTSVGTIKQALFRGVRKLRTRMPELRSYHA